MEPGASSADVLFSDLGAADMRLRRIAAELAQGTPLPQQIPALVELHLECAEAPNLLGSELTVLEESMLDLMYEIPSRLEVVGCTITRDVIEKKAPPILAYRSDRRRKEA